MDSSDKQLLKNLKSKALPNWKQFKYLGKFLSRRDLTWLLSGLGLLIIGLSFILSVYYQQHFFNQPVHGGNYTEGLVGKPRLINPLYADLSGVDADLSCLIYSSLFTRDSRGFLAKDLLADYQLSADQKTYTFKLINNAQWQNGDILNAADVLFTIEKIQDASYKSPLRSGLLGVQAKFIDDYTFSLTLPETYSQFPELLTFGILPKNLWEDTNASSAWLNELNLKPIGSGPFKFQTLTRDQSGNIHNYTLAANPLYYGTKPYLKNITFKFFVSPEELLAALNSGAINGANSVYPENLDSLSAKNSYTINYLQLPENSAVLFNLRDKNSPLANLKVRQALNLAINKQQLIQQNLGNNFEAINSPISPVSFAYSKDTTNYQYNLEAAKKLLADDGYQIASSSAGLLLSKQGLPLVIKLSILDNSTDNRLASAISSSWKELGVKTDIEVLEASDLNASVIKAKNFQALIYTWEVGMDPDPYYQWHSSQSGEKGLNLSGYANSKVDKLLENSRTTADLNQRLKDYQEFQKLLTADAPAVFLYSPRYIYIQNKQLKGFNTAVITVPEDRFSGIASWYLKENKSFKF